MYYNLFMHPTIDKYLGCFQFWTVFNNAAINLKCLSIDVQVRAVLWHTHQGAKWLSYKVCICSAMVDSVTKFSKMVVNVYIPTSRMWEFLLLCIVINT